MNAEEPAEREPAEELIELLQVAGMAEVAGEPLDVENLAGESGSPCQVCDPRSSNWIVWGCCTAVLMKGVHLCCSTPVGSI
jgi:hypothetical protein